VLSRLSERSLLAGRITRPPGASRSRRRALAAVSLAIAGAALAGLGASGAIDRTAAFFSCGAALLMAALFTAAHVFNRPPHTSLSGDRALPLWRVGFRNAAEHPGRSLFAIGVIASATFIVIAVDAFRRSGTPSGDRRSGTGGYSLLVDLLIPIASDPNGADGREALGLPDERSIAVDPFRVLPGDDASCLNLYRPQNPRVLGVPESFITAGRFAFQRSLAATDAERANPWLLLTRDFGPNVVPVIADANSMTYVLHRSLGEDVVSHGGESVRYRIVAALADSIFQREVLMSAVNFGRLFPEQEGYRFLLVDTPREGAAAVASAIERQASDLGADAVDTAARLDEFHAVENTYLATFQALGGLGLLVGTIGLAGVVLRNVLERRRELALLAAVGYRRSHLLVLVLSENLLLLGWGLGAGVVCALVAIAPAVLERGGRVPATATAALLLSAVFAAGLLSSFIATRAALRTPLLAALRSE
jgi:putative ABC transport system permease protein